MKFELSRPYTFENKEYKSIELNLDALNGSDMESAAEQAEVLLGNGSKTFAKGQAMFLLCTMAKAAGLPVEFFSGLPAKDYLKLKGEVNSFLFL